MILRKWRTEKPARSAALGISRNIFLGAVVSKVFMLYSLGQEKSKWATNGGKLAMRRLDMRITAFENCEFDSFELEIRTPSCRTLPSQMPLFACPILANKFYSSDRYG